MNSSIDIVDRFWSPNIESTKFHLYSTAHITALSIIVILIIIMFKNREALKKDEIRKKLGSIIGGILFFQQFFMYFWYWQTGNFTLQESLPLYTCRLSALLCIFMVSRGSFSVFEVIYFWGLGGATQALLTPDTGGFEFPHWMFLQFFVGHGGIIISIFFMMIAYEYTPKIQSLIKTIRWTLIYVFGVGMLNYVVDGNYSYLRYKPLTPTILDYFPKYPYYVPLMIGIMILLFVLLYLPFHIKLIYDIRSNKNMNRRLNI